MTARLHIVIRDANKRAWENLAKERIINTQPKIPQGKKFWPLSKSEKDGIKQLFEKRKMLELVTTLKYRDDDVKIEVSNAAF